MNILSFDVVIFFIYVGLLWKFGIVKYVYVLGNDLNICKIFIIFVEVN